MSRGLFKTNSLELKLWRQHPETPIPVGSSRYRLGTPNNRSTIILTDLIIQAASALAFRSKAPKVQVVARHDQHIMIDLPSGTSRPSRQKFLQVLEDAVKFTR